jgi:hypothetical protein
MTTDQSFSWINTAILFGSAGGGAIAGAVVQHLLSKAKPSIHVTSCELSSSLLSRVDYLEMPSGIAKKFNDFHWKLTIDNEQISSTANILPIGYAQENFYFLKEFLPIAEAAQELLKNELNRFKNGNQQVRKESVAKILHDPTVLNALLGDIRRCTFSVFKDVAYLKSLEIKDENTILPWAVDDASGVGKGTFGAFTILLEDARINFPFKWEDEKQRMAIVSFLLASLDKDKVPVLLDELLDTLNNDRVTANNIYLWFSENIDLNSTIVCNATINNMGKSPVLFSGKGILEVSLPNKKIVTLPCYSESYSDGTEEEKSVSRTVKVLRQISEFLDIAIPVRRRIITEKILVAGGESQNISLRTDKALNEIPDSMSLLNLYKSKKLTAKLILDKETGKKLQRNQSSSFIFSSSID